MALLLLLSLVSFQLVGAIVNLTSTGCADAAGFESCQSTATANNAPCFAQAAQLHSNLAVLACGCVESTDSFNCYATHCWNRVWECEYQAYMIQYFLTCPTASLPVPYFPTPADAPDACSCNIGEIFLAINGSIGAGATCMTNESKDFTSQTPGKLEACSCCEVSAGISSIYSICPSTDPSLVGLKQIATLEQDLQTQFSQCDASLSQYNCHSDLGFPEAAGGTFYSPANLPANGTGTLSNIAGTVTAPASGNVFSYSNTAVSMEYTISAANVGKVTGSRSGSAGASTTGSGASSGSTQTGLAGRDRWSMMNLGLCLASVLGFSFVL